MSKKKDLELLIKYLNDINNGLNGEPFNWRNKERCEATRLLQSAGYTLMGKSGIHRLGYRIKRGQNPVGSGYFRKPLDLTTGLYVLEIQCVKREKDNAN